MPETFSHRCPACQTLLKLNDTLVGKKIRCPKCSGTFTVPAPAAAPPAPPAAAPPKPRPAPAAKPAAPPEASEEEPPEEQTLHVPRRGRREEPSAEEAAPPKRGLVAPLLAVAVAVLYLGLALAFRLNLIGAPPPAPLTLAFLDEPPGGKGLPGPGDGGTERGGPKDTKDTRTGTGDRKDTKTGTGDRKDTRELTALPYPPRDARAEADRRRELTNRLNDAGKTEIGLVNALLQNDRVDRSPALDLATLSGHQARVEALAFAPDGKLLVSGDAGGVLKVWDLRTGQELRTLSGHKEKVTSVAFAPDGKLLASAGRDHAVRLWDTQTWEPKHTIDQGGQSWSDGVAFAPDGSVLACGGTDPGGRCLRLLNPTTGADAVAVSGVAGPVRALAFRPDGKVLAAVDGERVVFLDPVTGKPFDRRFPAEGVTRLGFFQHGGALLAAGERPGTSLRLLNPQDRTDRPMAQVGALALAVGPPVRRPVQPQDTGLVVWAARSEEGKDTDFHVWDSGDNTRTSGRFRTPLEDVSALAWSPGGDLLAAGAGPTVRLWYGYDLRNDAYYEAVDKVRPFASVRRNLSGLTAVLGASAKDDDLAVLAGIPVVTGIERGAGDAVSDAGLAHLAGAKHLRRLSLAGDDKVSDAGLAHLQGLTNLNRLDLSNTPVTDEGLKHLHGLKYLRTLDVRGTKVTPQGVAALKKAQPAVTVMGP